MPKMRVRSWLFVLGDSDSDRKIAKAADNAADLPVFDFAGPIGANSIGKLDRTALPWARKLLVSIGQ